MKTTNLALGLAAVGLAAVLAMQVARFGRVRQFSQPEPIEVGLGLPLPLEVVSGPSSIDLRCRVAFIADADCPECQTLAATVGHFGFVPALSPLWLLVSAPSRNQWFSDQFNLGEVYQFDTPDWMGPSSIKNYLHIPVVPTRLVFGAEGEVVDIRITTSLELPPTRDPACAYGVT